MNDNRQHPPTRRIHHIPLATLLLLAAILTGTASAQVISSYTFQSVPAQYIELPTAGIILKEWDGNQQAQINLGQRTFRFFGHDIDFSNPNNYIGLLVGGELIVGRDTLQFTFPAFLAGLRSRDASSSISHGIYSYLDDSVYVVQWKNAGFVTGDTANYVNFQIWMFMRSGVIEYHYGPRRIVGTEPFNGASGPSVGVVISDRGIQSWYSSIFLTGSPTTPSADPDSFFPVITGFPVDGRVYRFTPSPVASVTAADDRLSDLRVYPNPVSDRLTIELPRGTSSAGATAVIYDMLGRVVSEYGLEGNSSVLDLRELPSGIYHVEIRSGAERRTISVHRR